MEAIKTIIKENKKLEIFVDYNPQNPRTEWDNLGTFVSFESRYNNNESYYENHDDFYKDCKDFIYLDVYKYDHSGVIYNTKGFSCPWDSGQIGFIYIEKEKVRKEYGVKRISKKLKEMVRLCLEGEIETFSDYVSGNVYGFVLSENEEEIDSCWGFYGNDFKMNGMKDYIPVEFHDEL